MLRVFDFICPNGHRNELFVSAQTDETKCPECDKLAQRVISAPSVKLEGWSGSFPGAAMKWEKKHKEKMAQERKRNSD
jgi:predicted nucleic acid-binding Zn ribbon protein